MLHFRTEELLPMKLRDKWKPLSYQQSLQEVRRERRAETKQIERLSAILAKKVGSTKSTGAAARAA
jgi:hypothetical protein